VKGNSVYAVLLETPKGKSITLHSLFASNNMTIEKLAGSQKLSWSQKGRHLNIALPGPLPASEAHAFKMTPRPWQLVRE
jgi:hypothetical protein